MHCLLSGLPFLLLLCIRQMFWIGGRAERGPVLRPGPLGLHEEKFWGSIITHSILHPRQSMSLGTCSEWTDTHAEERRSTAWRSQSAQPSELKKPCAAAAPRPCSNRESRRWSCCCVLRADRLSRATLRRSSSCSSRPAPSAGSSFESFLYSRLSSGCGTRPARGCFVWWRPSLRPAAVLREQALHALSHLCRLLVACVHSARRHWRCWRWEGSS